MKGIKQGDAKRIGFCGKKEQIQLSRKALEKPFREKVRYYLD